VKFLKTNKMKKEKKPNCSQSEKNPNVGRCVNCPLGEMCKKLKRNLKEKL
jgi:hypothetical protein